MLSFQSLLWKFSFEALVQTTQYPLPVSAGIWADGFWQIVSIKEQTTFKGHRSRWPLILRTQFLEVIRAGRPPQSIHRAAPRMFRPYINSARRGTSSMYTNSPACYLLRYALTNTGARLAP